MTVPAFLSFRTLSDCMSIPYDHKTILDAIPRTPTRCARSWAGRAEAGGSTCSRWSCRRPPRSPSGSTSPTTSFCGSPWNTRSRSPQYHPCMSMDLSLSTHTHMHVYLPFAYDLLK